MRKKVDTRIRTLIENCVQTKHRSFIVLVGDHGKDQVPSLHYVLSKADVKARPSVLWCYSKELGFSTHRKKRMRQIRKAIQRGLHDPNKDDPFDLFVSSTTIRWTYYRDTHKVLGNTYGMCVLQDFEALTPNLLARTIETVEGGGVVVLLLRTMRSLKSLYRMTMDVHARFRTEAHGDVVPRFNERFLLSLGTCATCIVADDELNLLPISKHARNLERLAPPEDAAELLTPDERELATLKESLADTQPVGSLVAGARTLDQARAVLTFVDAVSEKSLRSTVALTAARGRGKSAALGTAIAAAVAYGYANIFVTAPSPENLHTVFEFVLKGFDALGYQDHLDYEVMQSTNQAFNRAVVRINIFKEHRQTIQYVQPHDADKLAQAELVVIDEAAAIPLPLVKRLLGPYLVFMASTVNGYEGTGRALSLKLVQQLREQQSAASQQAAAGAAAAVRGAAGSGKGARRVHEERWQAAAQTAASGATGARVLREITLETPIRYAAGDPVERWLHELLCLDVSAGAHRLSSGTPHPSQCELYRVNRDALFSFHRLSETFLQRVMALYVASHYKNTPNDLQLLSDAPGHELFVLLGPQTDEAAAAGGLPDVLCVVQVALEGQISAESVRSALGRGYRASGDLIPWTVSQQFQDAEFAQLSGARVVRISAHPDATRMGYGSRAVELLGRFYQGELFTGDWDDEEEGGQQQAAGAAAGDEPDEDILRSEKLKPRKNLPSLLESLADVRPQRLHWLGVSFGLTSQLLQFWRRAAFRSVYVRQTANDVTGEHTVVMLRALRCDDLPEAPEAGWLDNFVTDAKRRLMALLGFEFRKFSTDLALNMLEARGEGSGPADDATPVTAEQASFLISPRDQKRLETYARNLSDYHTVVDLVPTLASLFFSRQLPGVTLSALQAAMLAGIGLQRRDLDELGGEFNVRPEQMLALFHKSVRKVASHLRALQEAAVEAEMAPALEAARSSVAGAAGAMQPLAESLEREMDDARVRQEELLANMNLGQYEIGGTEADWEGVKPGQKRVQVKRAAGAGGDAGEEAAAAAPAAEDRPAKRAKKEKKAKKAGKAAKKARR